MAQSHSARRMQSGSEFASLRERIDRKARDVSETA